MTGHLVGYAILAVGTAVIVYAFTRSWATRFQRTADASLIPVPETGDAGGVGDNTPVGWNGPIVVEASELRGLIRDAVREALAVNGQALRGPGEAAPAP